MHAGLDEEGRRFQWVARRQRKRVRHPHEVDTAAVPPVDWFGALDARRYAANLGWWIAVLYTLGSALFIVSGAAGEVQSVAVPAQQPPGVTSLFAALIAWPNVVAANLCFFPAGLIQIVESSNMDWLGRLARWESGGRLDPRPRHRLLPRRQELASLSLWAAIIQLMGMLVSEPGWCLH